LTGRDFRLRVRALRIGPNGHPTCPINRPEIIARLNGEVYRQTMPESTESDDWIAGSEMAANAYNLTYFGGMSIQIDTSGLPDPPDDESEFS
jgi:hypothetical protein